MFTDEDVSCHPPPQKSPFKQFTSSQQVCPNFSNSTIGVSVLSLEFGWRTLGLKSGEVLASTYGLHHSLDGLT